MVKECFVCGGTKCRGHVLQDHIQIGPEFFCCECNERAISKLSEHNDDFEDTVERLEIKYGAVKKKGNVQYPAHFSGAMKRREHLRERYHAVGSNMNWKQREAERYEILFELHERPFGSK